ncbi:isocitrate dehydrogenase [NAD] subunit gamma, mitochondrial isoform X6 [Alligator mississippiensis]|uniref:isocitrate dehydrogenase [NAD] subunit gamma, mitochondrial isoform X6 n=1 Tax=Alligator mississippiensis TaxID=8496 RepID=UPI0009074D8E|nr:isocitrate dehydrogenase [NAD] subunit gamma, mitochondrial isoform X6 [Alligator mississippiensis]
MRMRLAKSRKISKRQRVSDGVVMAVVLKAPRRVWRAPLLGVRSVVTSCCSMTASSSSQQKPIPPPAKYGGRHMVTMIPGDGIGPELMLHVKEVFRHACVPVDFEEVRVSSEAPEDDMENAIMAIRRNGVALKGNIETNHYLPPSHKSRNHIIRTSLDLYANVIHCQSLPGVETRHQDIDILIVRENTEGEYSSLEHEAGKEPMCPDPAPTLAQSVAGVVESLKIITAERSQRIADYAFRLANATGRRKVTAVHKANIMKLGDGLFLQCCREVAAAYPNIAFESMIVDNTTMQATRNTGKSIAHKNVANPTATLLASCMMLDHLKPTHLTLGARAPHRRPCSPFCATYGHDAFVHYDDIIAPGPCHCSFPHT